MLYTYLHIAAYSMDYEPSLQSTITGNPQTAIKLNIICELICYCSNDRCFDPDECSVIVFRKPNVDVFWLVLPYSSIWAGQFSRAVNSFNADPFCTALLRALRWRSNMVVKISWKNSSPPMCQRIGDAHTQHGYRWGGGG